MKTTLATIAVALLGLQAIGCPPSEKSDAKPKPSTGPGPCTREGTSCEVSPGKLGTCVSKIDCDTTKGSCFTCQSQH